MKPVDITPGRVQQKGLTNCAARQQKEMRTLSAASSNANSVQNMQQVANENVDNENRNHLLTSTSQVCSEPSRRVTLHSMFFGLFTPFRGDLDNLLEEDFWESLSSSAWWSSC